MMPVPSEDSVLVMLNEPARTFSIPPAYLARFPNTNCWRIRIEPDGIKITLGQPQPPADHQPPTQAEVQAAIAETRAALRNQRDYCPA